MRFFLLFVALSFWHLSLCGAEAVASSDPNVDYILKGRSERIATYMKCSLSDEYCMCVEQVVRKGGEVFRCSVFLHTNNAYVVWQDASFSEAPQFAECAREVSALQGGRKYKVRGKGNWPRACAKGPAVTCALGRIAI